MAFYAVSIPHEIQPSLALAVEAEELGISAGLQDRVIQAYEGMVYMNFAPEHAQQRHQYTHYLYQRLDPSLLPPLYVAYHTDLSEPTEVFHNDIRGRFQRGETDVRQAMLRFAQITDEGRVAIEAGDTATLNRLIDANFDLRRSIAACLRGKCKWLRWRVRAGQRLSLLALAVPSSARTAIRQCMTACNTRSKQLAPT
ncbi:MAG UNVERIFIED_CONTAM: hypothetical protein LVT10_26140 [Anaerolineae bacterium]|jgi:glucuronokinase